MKTAFVLSTMAVLAAAGSAMAQGQATAAATLKLRIVPVSVSGTTLTFGGTAADVAFGSANRTRRFSIQYQIQEGAGFEGAIASLASLQMNVSSSQSGGSVSSSFGRSSLSRAQGSNAIGGAPADSGDAVGPTDTTGATTGTFAGVTGLHRAFRGGLSPNTAAGNTLPSNGTLTASGISQITPLTLSQLNQAPANDPTAWYGLYDFDITVGNNTGATDVLVSLAVAAIADSQTGNSWGAYEDGDVIPRTSRNSMSTGASFSVIADIPAPGSVALIGLGGLVAARRRRA